MSILFIGYASLGHTEMSALIQRFVSSMQN